MRSIREEVEVEEEEVGKKAEPAPVSFRMDESISLSFKFIL